MRSIIITAPSLDPTQNVSGVSSVAQFIIDNNPECEYQHFELGKKDKEKRGLGNVKRLVDCYSRWRKVIDESVEMKAERGDVIDESREARDERVEASDDRRDLRKGKTIVHYSFPLNAPSIIRDPFFMNYARRRGVKMVVHIHGGLFLTAPKIPFVLKRILKWVFSWDVPFIVLSEFEKEALQTKFGAKHVEVLPNCVDLRDAVEFSKMRGESIEKKEPLRMGFLGRIEPLKGMSELLEACKKLKDMGVQFKLLLAGKEKHENECLPKFEKELNGEGNKCFEYVGLVSGDTKCEFLRNLDVLVMPSYFEGLPMSLLEGMSYGIVPVITPVGSVPTVVNCYEGNDVGNANGLFVKVKDVDSIVDAIKLLDGNRLLLKALGGNARQTIFDNFSTEKYIDKLNSIYSAL